VVKPFLNKPDTSQGIVQRMLDTATKDCDSPDVRDRAYVYKPRGIGLADPSADSECHSFLRLPTLGILQDIFVHTRLYGEWT
jgi:hypothetical protein